MVTERRGRPPIDPGGQRAVKTPGIWLSPYQMTTFNSAVDRVAEYNGVSVPEARRLIIMSGVRTMETLLSEAEKLTESL